MSIRARGMEVELDTSTPRLWYGGRAFETHFFNALSSLLPEGERFLIKTVRHFEDHLVDEHHAKIIRGFIRQEGNHSKVHDQHIQLLLEQGFTGLKPMNRFLGSAMELYRRHTPRYALAVACVVEHMTTTLAHTLTDDPERWFEPMAEPMQKFWHWHAIEELEHKAVAFDLYLATHNDYPLRVLATAHVLFGFSVDLFTRHCYCLYVDRTLFSATEWRRGSQFLLGRRGLLRNMLSALKVYLRRDFHPDQDRDDQMLIDAYDHRPTG